MLVLICPAPRIPSNASSHGREQRMGLSLALFLFFCNSRLFAVFVDSIVQSFSCINLTDVNPYFFLLFLI